MLEVAERLRVDRSTLSRLLAKGKLGYYQVGARKLISEAQLSDYLRRAEHPVTAPKLAA